MKIKQYIPTSSFQNNTIDSTSYIYIKHIKSGGYSLHYDSFVMDTKSAKPTQTQAIDSKAYDRTSYIYYKVYKKPLLCSNKVVTSSEKIHKEIQKPKNNISANHSIFLFSTFIIGLIIVSISKIYYKNYINKLFLFLINYRDSVVLYRENKKNPKKISVLFSLNFYLIISSFIAISVNQTDIFPIINILVFAGLLGVVIFTIFVIRRTFSSVISTIFQVSDISKEYNFNLKIFNQITGIIILPLILGISYSDYPNFFIYIGGFAILIILVFRVLRFIKINFENSIPILYLFLYLCTLEIIPVIVVFKIVKILLIKSL